MPRLKKPDQEKRTTRTIRVSDSEWEPILEKARLYSDGNVSEWIRYASSRCKPDPRDLVPTPKKSTKTKKPKR